MPGETHSERVVHPAHPVRAQHVWSRVSAIWLRHRDAGVAFAIRVASAVLVFGLQVFLARRMTLADYGTFVTISTWIIVIAGFAVMGFGESALRFLPRYIVQERWPRVLQFFRFGLMLPVGVASLAAGLAVFAVLHMSLGETAQAIVVIVALGLPFAVADFFLEGAGRAMGWYKLAIVPTYILQPVLIGAIVFLLVLQDGTIDAVAASLVLIAVSASLTMARGVVMVWRLQHSAGSLRAAGAGREKVRRNAPAWRLLWLRASLPLMAVYGMDDFLLYSDVLLLGILSAPEDVGVYIAAVRTLAIANFIHYAFMLVAAREFSVANALRDRALLQARITESSRMTFMLTVPAVVLTLAAGEPLLGLFGKSFVVAYPAMVILGIGFIIRSTVGQAFDLLAVLGHARAIVWLSGGCLVANVALSLILIPLYGIVGAAAATAIVMALRATGLALTAQRMTGFAVIAFQRPADT